MVSQSRRSLLRALAPFSVLTVGGCVDVGYESPTTDLTLQNCTDAAIDVTVTVTRVESGNIVHDESHSVPEDYCSDVGDEVAVESVFDDAGDYLARADVAERDPVETTVSITETEAEDDTDVRRIRIDDDGMEIF